LPDGKNFEGWQPLDLVANNSCFYLETIYFCYRGQILHSFIKNINGKT